jgi:hypothetical protein
LQKGELGERCTPSLGWLSDLQDEGVERAEVEKAVSLPQIARPVLEPPTAKPGKESSNPHSPPKIPCLISTHKVFKPIHSFIPPSAPEGPPHATKSSPSRNYILYHRRPIPLCPICHHPHLFLPIRPPLLNLLDAAPSLLRPPPARRLHNLRCRMPSNFVDQPQPAFPLLPK